MDCSFHYVSNFKNRTDMGQSYSETGDTVTAVYSISVKRVFVRDKYNGWWHDKVSFLGNRCGKMWVFPSGGNRGKCVRGGDGGE